MALICQCAQKASSTNKRATTGIAQTAKSMMRETEKKTAEYLADSVLTSARVEAERMLKESRERMIENDTTGDYTRTKNAIEGTVFRVPIE